MMADKKKKKGFLSNWVVRNLLIAVVLVVVLIAGSMIFLNLVTQHNKELQVPDFSNMSVAEAEYAAAEAGMRVEVTDSVFVKRMKRGAVYRQNPTPGSKVKKGRRIVLTINAVNAKKVTMPDLVGRSVAQAGKGRTDVQRSRPEQTCVCAGHGYEQCASSAQGQQGNRTRNHDRERIADRSRTWSQRS